MRMVNIKDGYALQLAAKCGYHIAIITGGKSVATDIRYSALGIKDIFQGVAKKLPCLLEWLEKTGLETDQILYMGDDIPDIPVLQTVGLPCAPSDSASEVLQTAKYVSRFQGGHGCVRDVIEQVLRANDDWMSDTKAFGW